MDDKILVIGAAFVDVIMNVDNLPQSGSDVTGHLVSYNVGGSAFNVFGALQYKGARSDLFVPVGEGEYANMVRAKLKKDNVTPLLNAVGKDNGWDVVLVEPNGERSFITVQGIEQEWRSDWFDAIDLNDYRYFYISGYETEDQASSDLIFDRLDEKRADAYLLFDASPRISHISAKTRARLLTKNTIVHCNEDEIAYLSDEPGLDGKLADIYNRTQSPVLLTMGAKGTCLFDQLGKRVIPAEQVPVVNTIGAGDTHCGGVLAGLQAGLTIDQAVELGNQLSGQVVQVEAGSL